VKATGTEATPKTRLEKIARARAAQIGVENKLGYYKVANISFGSSCEKPHNFYKGGSTAGESRQTVEISVEYAKEKTGPDFVSAEESFTALNSELSNDTTTPEDKAAATAESRSACGLPV
jgi:hypothetical protein